MDRENNIIPSILIDKEVMIPILVQKLDEVHHFEYYITILWCLQTLCVNPTIRDNMVALHVIPKVIKVNNNIHALIKSY